jgi:cytochrome c biogenesis protein CcmG/thiol:disulfide interchange protein DsbE
MTETVSQTEAKPAPKFKWGQLVVWVVVIGLLALVAYQMRHSGPLAAGPVGVGEKAPVFTLTTFEGETYDLNALKGQVVLVNFWASWCIPCEQEAAALENTWRHYKDQGVVYLGVDYVDTETEARAFIKRYDGTYPNGPDLGTRVSQAYRIRGVPETYLIDRTGRLAYVKIGPFLGEQEIRDIIDPLLK